MIAVNQTFEDLTITLDGGTFHGCRFVRCKLRFAGLVLPEMGGGNTFEQCEWDFVGQAGQTLAFMQMLYHDQGGVDLVERVFTAVRSDRGPILSIALT